MTNDAARLSTPTVTLHWLLAIALAAMLAFGVSLSWVPSGPDKTALVQVHKSIGVIVLALAVVRAGWRWREGFPPPVARLADWEARLSRRVHILLTALAILIPLAGISTSITYARPVKIFGLPFIPQLLAEKNEALNEIFSAAHAGLATLLAALAAIHIAGALRHHVVLGDHTLRRMLGR